MKNLNIGTRLAAGFGVILLLTTLMTMISLWRLHGVADATHMMMQQNLAAERMTSDWYRLIHTSVRRTTAISKSTDPSLGAYFAEETESSNKEVAELRSRIDQLLKSPREQQLLADISALRARFVAARLAIVQLKKDGRIEEAEQTLEKTFAPTAKSYLQALADLVDLQRKGMDDTAAQIESDYQSGRNLLIGVGMAMLLAGALYAWWLTQGIVRPLDKALQIARSVAASDLRSRIEVTSKDQTGQLLQALKDMNDSLIHIVGSVRSGTELIVTGSTEIASGNLDLSSRTEEQASSLEESAASMEELTATVKQNAGNANRANALAQGASEVAARGGEVVAQVVETMGAISLSSQKIADIITVIDGIAFQTNILALNAAVEAARAGEQGRGFAVVATEVRGLAQRSATAAKEIKLLIDDSVRQVDSGRQLVAQAGATMAEIVASVDRVTQIMGEISVASREQSAGIEQVNLAIAQMDQVTQQNAALVEEAAAASGAMQDQATSLATAVSVFKLAEANPAGGLPPPPADALRRLTLKPARAGQVALPR